LSSSPNGLPYDEIGDSTKFAEVLGKKIEIVSEGSGGYQQIVCADLRSTAGKLRMNIGVNNRSIQIEGQNGNGRHNGFCERHSAGSSFGGVSPVRTD
jgi:hypothetical protein